jgi:hypothetical protein
MKKLTIEEKNYIAGFLDGDGSIFAQIVRGNDYKYGFRIRVFIGFYQKQNKHWFMLKLKKLLGNYGSLRIRSDGVSELVITGVGAVKHVLSQLKNSLILKKKNANLILEIIEKKRKVSSRDEFIEVCKLVDRVAELNYSKNRLITSETVQKSLFK